MAEAGIRQYLCPGVGGWNQWMNLIGDSYRNIVRMCGYARKYHAAGVLNTDWGDFGHINHPAHSVPGIIYGAAFSWNEEEISKEEMNRRISVVEYRDSSGHLVELMEELSACSLFSWHDAVMYYESTALGEPKVEFSIGEIPEMKGFRRERYRKPRKRYMPFVWNWGARQRRWTAREGA